MAEGAALRAVRGCLAAFPREARGERRSAERDGGGRGDPARGGPWCWAGPAAAPGPGPPGAPPQRAAAAWGHQRHPLRCRHVVVPRSRWSLKAPARRKRNSRKRSFNGYFSVYKVAKQSTIPASKISSCGITFVWEVRFLWHRPFGPLSSGASRRFPAGSESALTLSGL